MSWIKKNLPMEERFPYEVTKEIKKDQLENQVKMLKQLAFASFEFFTEKAYEDWVNAVTATARVVGLCTPLFQIGWANVTQNEEKARNRMMFVPDSPEDLIASVAQQRFGKSQYILDLETELLTDKRQHSLHAAEL